MDPNSAPPPPQMSDTNGTPLFTEQSDKIFAATFTCVTALILFVSYFIAITRFRLWHNNWILKQILVVVEHPLTNLIGITTAVLSTVEYNNHLYIIWLVVLNNAYDHVLSISAVPRYGWLVREYIALFYNIYVAVIMFKSEQRDSSIYYNPLTALWALLLGKMTARLVSNIGKNRAYGRKKSKMVSDYMKIEHKLAGSNEPVDPRSMTGYKYLVMGERDIYAKIRLVEQSECAADVKLPENVVTLETVWSCNMGLLDPSIDADNRMKDVCLSFAFFKLIKRRYYEYPAAEARQAKTRQLVFDGLLSCGDNERIYRVISSEIGFLRDFFYTSYPVIFAFGFPIFNVILVIGTFGICVWISCIAFSMRKYAGDSYLWSKHGKHNIDYLITNILLVMITVMEAFETLLYVISDWAKVILICRYVRRGLAHRNCFYEKLLALYCKLKFSPSVNRKIGQLSLLENYDGNYLNWLLVNCLNWLLVKCLQQQTLVSLPAIAAPIGMTRDKSVALSREVKGAILDSLQSMNGHPTNGIASLKQNGVYEDLAWTCALKTEFDTLIVWHIATGLCGVRPLNIENYADHVGLRTDSIEPHHSVANNLSNYCSYLMVFLPDMLPESSSSVQLLFRETLSEMKVFFRKARSSEDKYNLMMHADVSGNRVIDKALRLGKYLMQIPDNSRRWKIMADFWAEFIIFLAPSGRIQEHLEKLESGGEFITHLWALLYHAGIIVDRTATAYDGFYP